MLGTAALLLLVGLALCLQTDSFLRATCSDLRVHSARRSIIAFSSTPGSTTPAPDSWDEDMLKALGFDGDGSDDADATASLPPLSPEEAALLLEARFHVRAHVARVIKALVRELDRMYRSRFGTPPAPISWKVIRKAVLQTKIDLGKNDIAKTEAGRLFLRNTLTKKLKACDVEIADFLRAADVTSPEWKGQERRVKGNGISSSSSSSSSSSAEPTGQDAEQYPPFPTTQQLIQRLEEITQSLPAEYMVTINIATAVIRQTAVLVEKDEEREAGRVAAGKLWGEKQQAQREGQREVGVSGEAGVEQWQQRQSGAGARQGSGAGDDKAGTSGRVYRPERKKQRAANAGSANANASA